MQALPLFIVVVILFAAPVQSAEPLQENIAKLVSPVTTERQAGEAWLEKDGAAVIADLISRVENGKPQTQAEAIEALTLLVSPWQRGIEMGKRHHGQIELFRPQRPTGRPVNHPQAARLRKVLLAVLSKSLQAIPREPPANGDYALHSQHNRLISAAGKAFAEVADDATAKSLTAILTKEKDPSLGAQLMRFLETIYGLPTFYQMNLICGVGLTPEIQKRHEQQEAIEFEKQKQALLAWLNKHAGQTPAERIDAAIAIWAGGFSANPSYYSRDNGSPILTLARLGDAAVPGLRKQQARETTLRERAMYEVVAATITGKVDDKLVRDLMDAKQLNDANHHSLACEIIALANSQAYQAELAAMLADARYSSLDVAHTMAIVHRHDALPLLRLQPESNYTAHCAVKELESWERR